MRARTRPGPSCAEPGSRGPSPQPHPAEAAFSAFVTTYGRLVEADPEFEDRAQGARVVDERHIIEHGDLAARTIEQHDRPLGIQVPRHVQESVYFRWVAVQCQCPLLRQVGWRDRGKGTVDAGALKGDASEVRQTQRLTLVFNDEAGLRDLGGHFELTGDRE